MNKKVLLVDDEEVVRVVCERVLAGMDCVVVSADRNESALREVENGKFDLLVADLALPDGDSLPVLRAFRASNPDAPRLVMTASKGLIEKRWGGELARDVSFIDKPFELKDFRRRISELVGLALKN